MRCRDSWPMDFFSVDKQNADGRRNECGACRKERRVALARGAKRARPWQLVKAQRR